MSSTITRRQALVGVSGTLLLPAACSTVSLRPHALANEVFAHGVASGDPRATSVVLWTRVSGTDAAVPVDWQVASDPDLLSIVARGRITTDADRDHTVKVVADGLPAGRTLYYQFAANGRQSPVGRTKTLPRGELDELVVAIVSCSNYPFGFFNGYEAIADDPAIDVVVHLGDYIYEYDEDGYGGPQGKRIGRIHEPRHEIVTLSDYRMRHAQYKSDLGSLAMHARHPLIATWDDHETTNNPWTGGAQNHQPEEGDWERRREASLRAYYEWMPIRDPGPDGAPEELWRHYEFGDLASLITLESRHTGRSKQIELGDYEDRLTDPERARLFYAEVVGDPERRLLSADMERFVADALSASVRTGRRWRLIGNQTIMASVVAPRLDDPLFAQERERMSDSARGLLDMLTDFGALRLAGNMDAWDGYPAARERFYRIAREAGARDLLVMTGDTHVFWANALYDAAGIAMGVELGTSGITSPRGFYELGAAVTDRFDELVAGQNDSVLWVDGRYRGYIRLSLTEELARADFVAVSNIASPNFRTRTVKTATIVKTDGTLRYA